MNDQEKWSAEFSGETKATAAAIWALFRDVPGWKSWNAGIESIEMEGPFETGTWFTMKPPGQDAVRSRLIEVRENECFIDETRVGELCVRVEHRIESLGAGRTRVIYRLHATGAGASEIGPLVCADFPDVITALAARAEGVEPG